MMIGVNDEYKRIVASKIRKVILKELNNRGGFDEFWEGIHKETQDDIKRAIDERIMGVFADIYKLEVKQQNEPDGYK